MRAVGARYVPHATLLSAALLALLGACSKKPGAADAGEKAAGVAEKPDVPAPKDMKDMPGMAKAESGAANDAAGASTTEVAFTAAQVQHGKVHWEPVAMTTAAGTVTMPGEVVPNEDRTARLGAPAGGRVVAVRVSPGDRVARGQVLVTLVSPEAGMAQSDLSKAMAGLTSARAQAAYARAARDRAERLLALKAIPRQDYERAIADDAAAQATLTQAEAEVRRARSTAGQLGGGAAVTGEIAVRSPLAGVVLARTAVPGTVVEAGAPLVVVTDPSSLWLTVTAPEALSGGVRRGGELRFSVPAFLGETFAARIDAVGAGLDPATRTLPVRGVVTSGMGRLKPEMLASVTVAGGTAVSAVLLPDDAVQLVDGKPTVFLAKPDGKGGATFTARPVEMGSRSGGRVAVTRGLASGDVVVTVGAFAVKAQLQKGSMPEMEM
jgi:cobalt-zinc-cadmium efflux system membrane fusion protein